MSRLRFPGRPGSKLGKTLISYQEESRHQNENLNSNRNKLRQNFHLFHELFGSSSDEDDEFFGFTDEEFEEAKKLHKANISTFKSKEESSESKLRTRCSISGIRRRYKMLRNGLHISAEKKNNLPLEKSDKLNSVRLSSNVFSKNRIVAKQLVTKAKLKHKFEKIRNTNRKVSVSAKGPKYASNIYHTDNAPLKKRIQNDSDVKVGREAKKFPIFSVAKAMKRPRKKKVSSKRVIPPHHILSSNSTDVESKASPSCTDSEKLKAGLLEQPLIVHGKRPWKPSLKVQMKLSDMSNDYKNILTADNISNSSSTLSSSSSKELIRKDISKYADQIANKKALKESIETESDSLIASNSTSNLIQPAKLTFKSSYENSNHSNNAKDEDGKVIKDKVSAKIERLLKSQWEDRLRMPGRKPWKTCSLERDIFSSPSSAGNDVNQQNIALHRQSTQRRSKNILRKARLHLNKRTLQKLRKSEEINELSDRFESDKKAVKSTKTLVSFPVVSLENVDKITDSSAGVAVPMESASFGDDTKKCAICSQVKSHSEIKMFNNQLSCDTCRNFFSSFILSPKQLFCDKDGLCSVSSDDDLISLCEACWLKACFNHFSLTPSLLTLAEKYAPQYSMKSFPSKLDCRENEVSFSSLIETKSDSKDNKKDTPNLNEASDCSTAKKDKNEAARAGPRVKHVCRRASAVLGLPPATFPLPPELLSIQIDAVNDNTRSKISLSSDNKNQDEESVSLKEEVKTINTVEKSSESTTEKFVPKNKAKPKKIRLRSSRCKKCHECIREDCGDCGNCRDMVRYGGRGVLKKCCIFKKCSNPVPSPKSRVFDQKNVEEPHHELEEYDTEFTDDNDVDVPKIDKLKSSFLEKYKVLHSNEQIMANRFVSFNSKISYPNSSVASSLTKCANTGKTIYDDTANVKDGGAGSINNLQKPTNRGKIKKSLIKPSSFNKNKKFGASVCNNSKTSKMLCFRFWEDYDRDLIWNQGFGITCTSTIPNILLCFLCGSTANENNITCYVCCETFHLYCLDLDLMPSKSANKWSCKLCRYCSVCGLGNGGLLSCSSCNEIYHLKCISSHHPNMPSKKKCWLCINCSKCYSCGKRISSTHSEEKFRFTNKTYCSGCLTLKQLGNICPVCKKCYSASDFTSQMIQCSKCKVWVHSNCDNVSDDMYEILSILPDSVKYFCPLCSKGSNYLWLYEIQKHLNSGFLKILAYLLENLNKLSNKELSKSTQESNLLDNSSICDNIDSVKSKEIEPKKSTSLQTNLKTHGSALENLENFILNSDILGAAESFDENQIFSLDNESVKSFSTVSCSSQDPYLEDPVVYQSFSVDDYRASLKTQLPNLPKLICDLESKSLPMLSKMNVLTPLKHIMTRVRENHYKSVDEFCFELSSVLKSTSLFQVKISKELKLSDEFTAVFPWSRCDTNMYFSNHGFTSFDNFRINSQLKIVQHPCDHHNYALQSAEKTKICDYSTKGPASSPYKYQKQNDPRKCILCLQFGDDLDNKSGRLLYAGQNDWIHINCALWSAEVYEEVDGSLQNVHIAIVRGKQLKCEKCHKPGATVGCCERNCSFNCHFMCARRDKAIFKEDKKVFCFKHSKHANDKVQTNKQFKVERCVHIDLSDMFHAKLKKSWAKGISNDSIKVFSGSLIVESLGHLTENSNVNGLLIPVDYCCKRKFWSVQDPGNFTTYTLRTVEVVNKKKRIKVTQKHKKPSLKNRKINSFKKCKKNHSNVDPSSTESGNVLKGSSDNDMNSQKVETISGVAERDSKLENLNLKNEDTSSMQSVILDKKSLSPLPNSQNISSGLTQSINLDVKPLLNDPSKSQTLESDSRSNSYEAKNSVDPSTTVQNANLKDVMVLNDELASEKSNYHEPKNLSFEKNEIPSDKPSESSFSEEHMLKSIESNAQSFPKDSEKAVDGKLNDLEITNPENLPSQKMLLNNVPELNFGKDSVRSSLDGSFRLDGSGDKSSGENMDWNKKYSAPLSNDESKFKDKIKSSSKETDLFKKDGTVEFNEKTANVGVVKQTGVVSCSEIKKNVTVNGVRLNNKRKQKISLRNHFECRNDVPVHAKDTRSLKAFVGKYKALVLNSNVNIIGIHNRRKVFKCLICNKFCSYRCRLISHLEKHDNQSISCDTVSSESLVGNSSQKFIAPLSVEKVMSASKPRILYPKITSRKIVNPGCGVSSPLSSVQELQYPLNTLSSTPVPPSVLNPVDVFAPTFIQPSPINQNVFNHNLPLAPSMNVQLSPIPLPVTNAPIVSNNLQFCHSLNSLPVVSNTFPIALSSVPIQPVVAIQETPVYRTTMNVQNNCLQTVVGSQNLTSNGFVSPYTLNNSSQEVLYAGSINLTGSLVLPTSYTPIISNIATSNVTTVPNNTNAPECIALNSSVTSISQGEKVTSHPSSSSSPSKSVSPKTPIFSLAVKNSSKSINLSKGNVISIDFSKCGDPEKNLRETVQNFIGKDSNQVNAFVSQLKNLPNLAHLFQTESSKKTGSKKLTSNKTSNISYTFKNHKRTFTFPRKGCSSNSKIVDTTPKKASIKKISPKKAIQPEPVKIKINPIQAKKPDLKSNEAKASTKLHLPKVRAKNVLNGLTFSKNQSRGLLTPPEAYIIPVSPSQSDSETENDSPLLNKYLEVQRNKMKNSVGLNYVDEKLENFDPVDSHIEFIIESDEGFFAQSPSLNGAWSMLFSALLDSKTKGLLPNFISFDGIKMFGLDRHYIIYFIEQLPGAELFKKDCFKYHLPGISFVEEETLEESEFGCARAGSYKFKSKHDMFSFLSSKHRLLPELPIIREQSDSNYKSSRRATCTELPLAMRFRHLTATAKESLGVYRSLIHGRGLFIKRDFESGEMVVEYAGEVIRSVLTDKREKYYESKGIGCYMFRIDDYEVVDATMHGNAARFINHSCEPNCYSKVIQVDGTKHIVIFASRKIFQGEELTYNYKFPIEEVKIPCTCGSKRCRKYLN